METQIEAFKDNAIAKSKVLYLDIFIFILKDVISHTSFRGEK